MLQLSSVFCFVFLFFLKKTSQLLKNSIPSFLCILSFISVAAKDHSDADCFGVAILSHGREGAVFATDGSVPLNILVLPFKGDRAPSLVGKPKLFFIQVKSKTFYVLFFVFLRHTAEICLVTRCLISYLLIVHTVGGV